MKNWREIFPFDFSTVLTILSTFSIAIFFICTGIEVLDIFHFTLTQEAKVFKVFWPFSFIVCIVILHIKIWLTLQKLYSHLNSKSNRLKRIYKLFFNFLVLTIIPLLLIFYLILNAYIEKTKYFSTVENVVSLYQDDLEKMHSNRSQCILELEKNIKLESDLRSMSGARDKIILFSNASGTYDIFARQSLDTCIFENHFCSIEECDYLNSVFQDEFKKPFLRKMEKEYWIYFPIAIQTKANVLLFKFPIE